jgi:type II secretory pathway pseudopilin PulG
MELVVVVLLIGILASITVPMFLGALARHRSSQAARRIVADLELARREASMASTSRKVVFSSAAENYTLAAVAHLDRAGETYSVSLRGDPYYVDIVSADLGGDEELVFDGFGQADSGGTIVVRSGGVDNTIVIDAATGQASVL